MTDEVEVSIVIPCLNEAESIGHCLDAAHEGLQKGGLTGEIVVADNGSEDGSQEIARKSGARVVNVEKQGYGAALAGGIAASRGRFVIMGDADGSYDFRRISPFIEKLRSGDDLVMGNRFAGGIEDGAMPTLNRYLGNPVLSFLGRLFFRSNIRDFHCGIRGFKRDQVLGLKLQSDGMEFASEMVVKATINGLKISEVPTTLSPDLRNRKPHLRPWRDGWRHLRFLLLFSPRWLFLYPGLIAMAIGVLIAGLVLPEPMEVFGVRLDVHTLIYACALVVIGFQMVLFALFARVYATSAGFLPERTWIENLVDRWNLELGLLVGSLIVVAGVSMTVAALAVWGGRGFDELDYEATMRLVIPGASLLVLGSQAILGSFLISILGIQRDGNPNVNKKRDEVVG